MAEEDRTLRRLTRKEQVEEGFWEEYIFTPSEHLGAFLEASEENTTGDRLSRDLLSM